MRKSICAILVVSLGITPVVCLALLRSAFAAPPMLFNPSPSEPTGFYVLTGDAPRPGRLIAFHVPPAGRSYASKHILYVMRNAILKEVVASAGTMVCEREGTIFVDGRFRGVVAQRDRNGAALPHWLGCRRLETGEYFVLSNRIPNSFDSRYYGPVRAPQVLGVYAPLWTE